MTDVGMRSALRAVSGERGYVSHVEDVWAEIKGVSEGTPGQGARSKYSRAGEGCINLGRGGKIWKKETSYIG